MKNTRLLPLLLLLILLMSRPVSAQRFLGGVSVGANFCQVDGDEFYGFRKIGLNAGPMVALQFGKKQNWSVSMELLYSQRGSYHGGSSDSTTYRLNLDYIDVPILVHFTDKKFISAGVGFAYGQLVGKKESSLYIYPDSLYQGSMQPYDLTVIGDVSLRVWKRLWVDVRYQYSMVKIRTVTVAPTGMDPWTRDQYNNLFSIRLTYMFNQEIPGKPRKPKGEE